MGRIEDIVITGVGVVSPTGVGRAAYWRAALEARSGVRPLPKLAAAGMPIAFGGSLEDFDPKQYVKPRKSLKVMCREIQIGYAAAALAMADAGLGPGAVAPDRLGVVMGSDMYFCELEDLREVYANCMVDGRFDFSRWGERFMSDVYPLWMLRYLPNMTACHIAIAQDARGPNNTLASGDASGLLALAEAATHVAAGRADVMLAGGVGCQLHPTRVLCAAGSQLSQRRDDPAGACRPFDADRDGLVLGEGGAVFVLERAERAAQRGAPPLARLLGWGRAWGRVGQRPETCRAAIRAALARALDAAGVAARDVGHVNAHAAGLTEQDAAEAQAIRDVLGDVPVTAPKSWFGYLGAGGGAVEGVASVLAIAADQVPPTRNYERPDPACPVRVVRGEPWSGAGPAAVLLSHSRTGQAAAAVLAAP